MLLADKTVTLYHKAGRDPATKADLWTVALLENASWFTRRVSTVSDKGLLSANVHTIRICTKESVAAVPGDVLALGDREEATPKEMIAAGAQHCTLVGVTDNRRGAPHLGHWKVEGV